MTTNIAAIILAAGKGERMRSETPKVLHPVCGRPMIGYCLDLVKSLRIKNKVVVTGYKHQEVKKALNPDIKTVIQKKLNGTASAVKEALPLLRNFKGTVLVLYGDTPLLKKETITKLLKHHIQNKLDATLLTAQLDNPAGYGRVLYDKYASLCGIVEDKDADDFQKALKEINTGIICFNKESLSKALSKVMPHNRKNEYYLTDVIEILYKAHKLLDSIRINDINEAQGINSPVDLAKANAIMQRKINEGFMNSGVTIIDPATTFINYGTKIGKGTIIYPFTVIERDVKIGKSSFVGPFAHLREGTQIGDNVTAGNFLEIVRSRISSDTFIKHFSYLGDSRIGKQVNIGAGTVIANFDGKLKHNTIVGDKAFIGSDTVLVAPVKIGKAAKVGAGSVVLKNRNVSSGAVVAGVPARPLKAKGNK